MERVPPRSLIPKDCDPLYWQEVEEFDGSWLFLRLKALEDAPWDIQPLKNFLPSDASCEQAHRLIILSGPIGVSLERLETRPNDVKKALRLGRRGRF